MSNYFEEKNLIEQRAGVHTKMKELVSKATDEKRGLAEDEQTQFDSWDSEFEGLSAKIEQVRKLNKREEQLSDLKDKAKEDRNISPNELEDNVNCYTDAFKKHVRGFSLNEEEIRLLQEQRAQSTTSTAGGYTIPEGFVNNLEQARLSFGGILEAADTIYTATGNTLPFPTTNDTANTGALLAENTQDSEQDITFGVVELGAYKYTSKIVRVSKELVQDSAFNMDALISENIFKERLYRILNTHFTTGDGSSKPKGVVTATTNSYTAPSASAITNKDLTELEHKVDPAYRVRGNAKCGYMFSDVTFKELKSLTVGTSDSRPIWQPSYAVGAPDTINGWRYWINQDLDDVNTSGNKSILFGDFSKYKIRIVRDYTLVRLQERYADFHQVGYIGFMRADGDLINAGTHPIAYLTQ